MLSVQLEQMKRQFRWISPHHDRNVTARELPIMKSLYAKFIFLGLVFITVSVSLQFMWWKRLLMIYGKDDKTEDTEADVTVDKQTRLVDSLRCNKSSIDCERGILRQSVKQEKQWISDIWNTSSGKDRILEQITYVPASIRLAGVGTLREKVIMVESGPENWGVKRGNFKFVEEECSVRSCKLVGREHGEKKVDAILFGQNLPFLNSYLEQYKSLDTVWIYFALESPKATGSYHHAENYINWTATYRKDSTIVAPYERWVPLENATSSGKNYAAGKTKMAAIFVSNCGSTNGRLDFVKELGKHVQVDIYGFCGNKQCPRRQANECFKMLDKDYKFYLSFENANCRDYITEKLFWNGLRNDIIPIVMGAHPDDYRQAAPPHSYIHVEDFPSVKALAEYMIHLDENDEEYNKYFKWKGTGSFINTKFWCRLCAMIHDDKKPTLIVENLEKWWRPNDICRKDRWTTIN